MTHANREGFYGNRRKPQAKRKTRMETLTKTLAPLFRSVKASADKDLAVQKRFFAKQKRKTKTIKAWGGFTDDKLWWSPDNECYDEPRISIFPTRRDAKRAYEDVRRVTITWEVEG